MGAAAALAFLKGVALADVPEGAPLMAPVIETILPFGSPRFPGVPVRMVAERIESLYHLAESPTFRGSLSAFLSLRSFTAPDAALYAAERSETPDADIPAQTETDARAYRLAALPDATEFAQLSYQQRSTYLGLWSRSAFNTRRRFYQSVRFITFAAFYSMPEVWPTIGYTGPLLQGGRS
jgi:hypothetical protein